MSYDKNLVSLLAERLKTYYDDKTTVEKTKITANTDKTAARKNDTESGTKGYVSNQEELEKNLLCIEINPD